MPKVQLRVAAKPYVCGRVGCGKTIEKGEKYYVAKPFRRPKVIRCSAHMPSPSELTSSEGMAAVFEAQEALGQVTIDQESPEVVASDVRGVAEQAREAGQVFEQSAENIEEGFQHETTQSDELREKAQMVEEWADEIESAADQVEGVEMVCGECDHAKDDHVEDVCQTCRDTDGADKATFEHEFDDSKWQDEVQDFINDAQGAMPL